MKKNMNYMAFLWHAALLAITATFIEINTVLPAMIIQIGGNEFHIGIMTSIMIGVPMMPNPKIAPQPSGIYFFIAAWEGCDSRPA